MTSRIGLSDLRDSISLLRNRAAPVVPVASPEDENIVALWEAVGLLVAAIDHTHPDPQTPD
jgi:hypothetical protein